MLTPRDISDKKFEKSAFGYKTDEVDDFLNEIVEGYAKLYAEKNEAEEKMEVLAEKLEEYRSNEDSLRTVLIGAQKLGDNIIRDAKAKAEVILNEADSKVKLIYAESEGQIIKEKDTLTELQQKTAEFKKTLLAMYKQHLELISLMPEENHNEAVAENEPENEVEAPVPEFSPAEMPQDDEPAFSKNIFPDADAETAEEENDINVDETKRIDLQF